MLFHFFLNDFRLFFFAVLPLLWTNRTLKFLLEYLKFVQFPCEQVPQLHRE